MILGNVISKCPYVYCGLCRFSLLKSTKAFSNVNYLSHGSILRENIKMFACSALHGLNTLRPRQNGRRFADDTFKRIFLNENVRISITISLKFVRRGPINTIPSLVQIMAWRRSGDKPLSEPMMVTLPTHICVTRPKGVKRLCPEATTVFDFKAAPLSRL